jgi:tetratricopeptide (TPR) repeat protein
VASGERLHGERHPAVGRDLQNLGAALMRSGALDEAQAVFERVAALYRESLSTKDYVRGLPLLSLSGIHLERQRPAAAHDAARESLEILEAALPDTHYITAVARCRVGRALVDLGRPDEAAPFFAQAAGPLIATRSVPEYRQECLRAAADLFDKRGQPDEARRLRAALDGPGT